LASAGKFGMFESRGGDREYQFPSFAHLAADPADVRVPRPVEQRRRQWGSLLSFPNIEMLHGLEGGQFCPQPAFSRLWPPKKAAAAKIGRPPIPARIGVSRENY